MVKGDLIFNWRRRESHPGHKIVSVALVAAIFTLFFGILNVRMKPPGTPVLETASLLYFGDDGMGRMWRLRAEEEGPFPGRLQIDMGEELLDPKGVGGLSDGSGWGGYRVELLPFQAEADSFSNGLSLKGRRYFPGRVASEAGETAKVEETPPIKEVKMRPVLTPYNKEAQEWMPENLPEFGLKMEGGPASASWRFVLSLREDGSVEECVALSGGEDEGLKGMCGWLAGLKFKEGSGERWFGVRVEFTNR